jgi:acetyl-CoA carboxylase biotin carboxyl carrier protein
MPAASDPRKDLASIEERMPAKNARGGGGTERAWEFKEIQKLIDLLIERGIEEFEMERNGLRIRIKRGGGSTTMVPALQVVPAAVASVAAGVSQTSPTAPLAAENVSEPRAGVAAAEGQEEETTEELHIVRSPIVGTFYSAAAPNGPDFVKLGDVVKVGQVLCIIEAMKLMNEIESDVAGEIVRIYVESGQPVEYGQSLFAIKPSHKK